LQTGGSAHILSQETLNPFKRPESSTAVITVHPRKHCLDVWSLDLATLRNLAIDLKNIAQGASKYGKSLALSNMS
jgi:hypothetical protein